MEFIDRLLNSLLSNRFEIDDAQLDELMDYYTQANWALTYACEGPRARAPYRCRP